MDILITYYWEISRSKFLAGKVQCFPISDMSIKVWSLSKENPLFVKLDRVSSLFVTTFETQLMLQQMTSDLNKNDDKIWEPVTALNNACNNAVYKDAVESPLLTMIVACKATAYNVVLRRDWMHPSRFLTFDSRSLCCAQALWPQNPLLVVAKWSFVTPGVSAVWYW